MAGTFRCQRADTLTVMPEQGSQRIPCGRCGAMLAVSPQSLRFSVGMTPVCEICLPAEPIGPVGFEHA